MRARPVPATLLSACLALALLTTGGVERRAARLNNQGNTRFEAGKFDEAVELYDEAHTRAPESPEIAYNHGNALYKQGRLEDAAAQLRRGTLSPDPELRRKSLYNLGNALHDLKKLPEAASAYRQALALDPRDRKAKINYEKTLQELQQQQQQQQQQGQSSQQDPQQEPEQDQQQGQGQQDPNQQNEQRAESKEQNEQSGQQKDEGSRQDSQQESGGQEEESQETQQPQLAALDSVAAGDLSPEEAIRILEAMREQERELQKERARKPVRNRRVDKDW